MVAILKNIFKQNQNFQGIGLGDRLFNFFLKIILKEIDITLGKPLNSYNNT